ncbi:hypothetical protein GGC47_003959 [Bosea sp. OAE752]|uniref:DUF6634 family protein n=1 Tax=Bosea sp. OAE752 TaxID=2663873 RepID=UPI003D19C9A2
MRELVQKITDAAADLRRLEEGWLPSDADLRDAVILEDWMIGRDPLTGQTVFWGRSIGHPILGDRPITTSPLIWVNEDRTIARTLSRWYRLGKCASPPTDVPSPEPEASGP